MIVLTNEQIIDEFKARDASTRRQIHVFVKTMGIEARGHEVEAILLGKGLAICAAREWGNAHLMREFMRKRANLRKYRKETSAYGTRGQADRSIIATTVYGNRRAEFHATKGRRNFRISA